MPAKNWKLIVKPESADPAVNLAMEEWAIRHLNPDYSYLFFYVNRPAVILGRNQNVLQEVNLRACWENDIPILRRISGGGAVVHDEGNLNFAFVTQHTLQNFNRYRQFLEPIVQLLRKLGLPVEIDSHNNLLFMGKKFSGNAQFTSRGRLLSHGTLLFNSNLERLNTLLNPNRNYRLRSNATRSMHSNVTNLHPYMKLRLSLNRLREMIIDAFLGGHADVLSLSETQWDEICALADRKYRSYQWNIARSPKSRIDAHIAAPAGGEFSFHYYFEDGYFRNFEISDSRLRFLGELLDGKPLLPETFEKISEHINAIDDAFLQKKARNVLHFLI